MPTRVLQAEFALGRESFKRTDDGTELMNINGEAGGTPVDVWDGEGTYWTAGGTGSKTTGSKHSGTYGWDSGVTSVGNNTDFDNGSEIDVNGTYSELRFWLQPKAYPPGARLRVVWLNDADTVVGSSLLISNYVSNMDLDVWQQVSIPITDFNLTENVQKLRFRYLNAASQQFWLDDINLIPPGSSGGPYRFQIAAPDANTVYHVTMLVLMLAEADTGWTSSAFATIAGGLANGLVCRQRKISTSEVLWRFNTKDNIDLFGQYHPQESFVFDNNEMLVGFMVKPGKASIIVTNDDVLEFLVRDDLDSLNAVRAYAHYGVEVTP